MFFNVDKLVSFFGGVSSLANGLKQIGHPVSIDTVYKWKQRNSLPLARLEQIILLAQKQGKKFDLNLFLFVNDEHLHSVKTLAIKEGETIMRNTAAKKDNQIIIFDTTLRDGEQTPGAAMTKEEKIRIALQLEKLGVDVIEAGFAAASSGDFQAVNEIAQIVEKSTVCSLARSNEKDVRRAGEAVKPAKSGRVHTFIATSPIHMKYKLNKTPQEVISAAVQSVQIATEYTDDIEFSAEDATRSEIDFLIEIFTQVIKAGATTINIPDTVGYTIAQEWRNHFKTIIERVKDSDKVIWSTHCHNDLGMAVANSIAAIEGGARQVECTINGMGERAGNASLEEIVMILKTRKDILDYYTNVNTIQLLPTAKLVSTVTGYPIPANKSVVGINAFTHESGIHQDGVLKHRETYEIMTPESVGWETNRLTLGKLSGRNAFKTKLNELGIILNSEEQINAAFRRFKELADKKRDIFDEDLHALISDEINETPSEQFFKLIALKISTETGETPTAEIVFNYGNEEIKAIGQGSGPVDAVFKTIESIAKSNSELQLYSVNAVTSGTESQAEVTVRLLKDNEVLNGQGADIDVIVASAKAYLSALNKMTHRDQKIREAI